MACFDASRTNPLQFTISLPNGDEIVAIGSVGDLTKHADDTITAGIEATMTVYRIKHELNRDEANQLARALKALGIEVVVD